jgi:hypothetical protein
MDLAKTRPYGLRSGASAASHAPHSSRNWSRDRLTHVSFRPEPEPCVSAMVVDAVRLIEVDTTSFSGVCGHMGGLTVATEAGVRTRLPPDMSASRTLTVCTTPGVLSATSRLRLPPGAPSRDAGGGDNGFMPFHAWSRHLAEHCSSLRCSCRTIALTGRRTS